MMVRTAFALVTLFLCAFLLPETAQAQEIAPRSYLFVEVADTAGQTISDATVRVSNQTGKEVLNVKTSRSGTADAAFNGGWGGHFDLQISKSGYLPYETVLFSNRTQNDYLLRLTDEIPNSTDPTNSPTGPPALKITLRKTPSTPAEVRAAETEANKRQLLLAIKRGDVPGVRNLLQQGISPDTADAKGVPAVAWATFAGDPEIIKLLLDGGANLRNKASPALLIYLTEGAGRTRAQAEIVDKLIAAGVDVNASSPQGRVLNKAIFHTTSTLPLPTFKALIQAGADVNAADASGQTPLMLAALLNQNELLALLLDSGAKRSILAKDKDGRSALGHAARGYRGQTLQIVKVLLAKGAVATEPEGAITPLMFAAQAGAPETVQVLLQAGSSVKAKDKQGQTALMYAVRDYYYSPDRKAPQTVKVLLANGAQINDVDADRRSALIHAANGAADLELIRLLIASGANVNLIDKDGQTALLLAVQRNATGAVQELLKAGAAATINAKNSQGRTALLYAAEYGREDMTRALLEEGAFVNEVNEKGQTPLIVAVQRGYSGLVSLLLKSDASINLSDKEGNTALMYARSAGSGPDDEILKALVAAGADLNHTDKEGQTPLIIAAGKANNVAALRQLLATDAKKSIHARTVRGETALMYATAYGDQANVAELLAAGANANDADPGGQTVIMRAVQKYESSVDLTRMLIKAGANVNAADSQGRTALLSLTYLYTERLDPIVKELIAAGANVNAADKTGQTVLMSLVQRKYPTLVRMVLEAGATVNTKDRKGRTALFYALSDNNGVMLEILRLLIAGGANANETDEYAQTPLMLAADRASDGAVYMLLNAGATTNAKDKVGRSALMHAAAVENSKDAIEVVKQLLAAKAKVDDTDQSGQTALMLAAHTGNLKMVQALLQANASVKTKDKDGKTALIHAADEARNETANVLQVLIAAGANVNESDGRRQTPLMLAALRGFADNVTTLLKAGASVNAKDETGLTPLIFAAWGSGVSSTEIVKALLKAGAKINDADKEGKSALMFAAQRGSTQLLPLLFDARAKVNAKTLGGETALIIAIKGYGSDDPKLATVKLLLSAGADVNVKDSEGQTPLAIARKLGQLAIVKLLEEAR